MSDEAKFVKAIAEMHAMREQSGVEIRGKLYSMVKDRVEMFRKTWGSEFGIHTSLSSDHGFSKGSVITMQALVIRTDNGQVVATGHAMETIGKDEITTTAAVEACETAAIGRALACFGLHGGEFASESEMVSIPRKQEQNVIHMNPRNAAPAVASLTSGFYIPPDDNKAWNNPHHYIDLVIREVSQIAGKNNLAKYWDELEPFRKMVESQTPDRLSEVQEAFAQQFQKQQR